MTDRKRSWDHIELVMRRVGHLPFPANYYRAENVGGCENDALFIEEQLSRLTLAQRTRAAEAYSAAYTGLDSRAECNRRLREFCDRCERANRGEVKKFGD